LRICAHGNGGFQSFRQTMPKVATRNLQHVPPVIQLNP